MQTTDAQVRRLMEEIEKHGGIGLAAMRAGMDRKTARKYVRTGKLPSELRKPHIWRTREDPFAEHWAVLVAMLEEAPELEATTLFDHLSGLKPEAHTAGQLRTLQRRIREWRAQRGPEREIFFPQAHRPGEAIQTDFTHATVLGVTISASSRQRCPPQPAQSSACSAVLLPQREGHSINGTRWSLLTQADQRDRLPAGFRRVAGRGRRSTCSRRLISSLEIPPSASWRCRDRSMSARNRAFVLRLTVSRSAFSMGISAATGRPW